MTRRALALSTLLLLGAASPALSQERELSVALERLATSWARGDAVAVASFAAKAGVSFERERAGSGPLAQRQVVALLRRLFEERETLQVRLGMVHVVSETPPHAFGELSWVHRARGTTMPESATVFLGWVREGDAWRLNQIRLLP